MDGQPLPETELPFRQLMASGQAIRNATYAIQHPNGQRVLLNINAAPLRNAHGEIAGMVSYITEVAQRREPQ